MKYISVWYFINWTCIHLNLTSFVCMNWMITHHLNDILNIWYFIVFYHTAAGSLVAKFRSKQLGEIDDNFVISSTVTKDSPDYRLNDVVSMEIPLSVNHRCLHYNHLVIGESASLVVDYITDYTDPYSLWDVLNIHPNASVIRFSRASATLPVLMNFKVSKPLCFHTKSNIILLEIQNVYFISM